MRKIFIFGLFLLSFQVTGQQEPQLSSASINPYLINPAAGGLTDVLEANLIYRTQWTNYSGSPNTNIFTINGPLKLESNNTSKEKGKMHKLPQRTSGKIKHVFGGKFVNDIIGPFSENAIDISYAIHLPFFNSINFGAGVGLGFNNFRVNEDRVSLYNPNDFAYSSFLSSTSSQTSLNANAGLIFYNKDFYLGGSIYQLIENKLTFNDIESLSRFMNHYYIQGAYRFKVGNRLNIEPNLIGKIAQEIPYSFELGMRFYYDNAAWIAFQYRTSNSLVFRVGSTLTKNLYLGYGYELSTGGMQNSNSGSHEIQLGIFFRKKNVENKDKKVIEESSETEVN